MRCYVKNPVYLFVATMAWGFGERGYGWHRTRPMFGMDGERRVVDLVDELKSVTSSPEDTWRTLKGRRRFAVGAAVAP